MQRWWALRREVRFLIAGAYNTAFGYAVFTLLFELFGRQINYLVIGCLSQAVSVVSAFLVYRRYVFGTATSWPSSFLRFNISQLASFTFGTAGLYLLVADSGLSPVLAQAIVICAAVVISYILHRYFSFRVDDDRRRLMVRSPQSVRAHALKTRIALITGGASGIGAALVRKLVAAGSTVIVADSNVGDTKDHRESTVRFIQSDVSKSDQIETLFVAVKSDYPSLDLVINCAGVCGYGEASTFTREQWERELGINLMGTINVSMAAYTVMQAQGGGVIANLSSVAVFLQPPLFAPYVTGKAGILAFSRALALEGERHNIQVSVVCPGNVRTPMLGGWKQSSITPAISADDVADRILSGLARGRRIIVFPLHARIFWYLDRLSPRLLNPLRRAILRRSRKRGSETN